MTRRLLIILALLVPTVASASASGSAPRVVAKIKVGIAPCAGLTFIEGADH